MTSKLSVLPKTTSTWHPTSTRSAARTFSPGLLVRGDPLVVVDGYPLICASFLLDESMAIDCRMVNRR